MKTRLKTRYVSRRRQGEWALVLLVAALLLGIILTGQAINLSSAEPVGFLSGP